MSEDVTFYARFDVSKVTEDVKELNDALTTYIALSNRLGLTGPLFEIIAKFQQARIAAETAARSVQLFYATSGPIGWALLVGGLTLSGLMMADVVGATEMRRPRY